MLEEKQIKDTSLNGNGRGVGWGLGGGVKCSVVLALICPFDETLGGQAKHETGRSSIRTHPAKSVFNLIFFTFNFCVHIFLMKLKIIKHNKGPGGSSWLSKECGPGGWGERDGTEHCKINKSN